MKRKPGLLLLAACAVGLVLPDTADAQYFGRNQVQYRSFDFQIIRTDHFDIYYYPQKREAALDAARMIERSYARLSRLLQHEFRERKPVILYASHAEFQQTNALGGLHLDESTGGVTESAKHRIIMPFTGSYAEFDHVLTHELVHQFQYDVIFRRAAPDASPLMMRLPLWFMEGMAEYLALGRVDPHTESWLRDAVLTGYLRTIEEMNQRDDYLSYRFGQSLWAYIGERWGDDVIGMLLQKAPRMGVHRAFATTLGVSLDELSAEWTAAVRRTYLPQVASFGRPDAFAQRLTGQRALRDPWFLAPALSPAGDVMVYTSQRNGRSFDLWLAAARDGRVLRRLVASARNPDFESLRYLNSGAAFSPDGRFLAFVAQTGGGDALYIFDLERDRGVKRLRFALNGLANPSWSPDGRRLVFSGNDGGVTDLFVTDLDGRLERLTDDRHAALLPSWSPDGRRIAFSTDRGSADLERLTYGNYRVALLDLETRDIQVLPHQDEGKNINAVWSPDGAQLIWVSDRTGTNNLYLFDLRAESLDRISDVLSGVIAITPLSPVLSWSRSGRLLFTYFEQAGYSVYAIEDPHALPRVPVVDRASIARVPAAAGSAIAAAVPAGSGSDTVAADVGAEDTPASSALAGKGIPEVLLGASPVASFYRSEAGLRPSHAAAPAREAVEPVSVVALLDSAALALPDTAQFELRPYRVRFTPDFIARPTVGAQVGGHYGSGLYGGSFIALSDMLGNHNMLFAGSVNGSLSDAAFYGAYSYLRPRANIGGAIVQQPMYRYLGSGYFDLPHDDDSKEVAANVFLRDVVRSAQAHVSYPLNTFRRIEIGASAVNYQRDLLYRGYYRDSREPLIEDRSIGGLTYAQPMAALVFDNASFGWTGPVDGRRYRLQLAHSYGDVGFTEALFDVRNYLNMAGSVVFATRFIALARMGGSAEQFRNYWGGPYFLRGYDGGSFRMDSDECRYGRTEDGNQSPCPARDQLIGSSAAIVNAELRFPVITELRLGALGSFPPIDGLFFMDGGIAWDEEICGAANLFDPTTCAAADRQRVRLAWSRQAADDPLLVRRPLYSYGAGLRINVLYAVLRLDYAIPLNRPAYGGRKGVFSLSFGPSF
jgi:Tol biopolymer transport system component